MAQQTEQPTACPACGQPMRREYDGVSLPPKPHVFWFCTNRACPDGQHNKLFSGG
ncbi:MAG: hypothetical protein HYX93_01880 [Chloroflexi bacterium]|nr:hypothetical protein [Chloroflexota bacterium]